MATSNYTRLAHPGYAGMIKTMKAIDECFTQYSCFLNNVTCESGCSAGDCFENCMGEYFHDTTYYNQQDETAKNPYENITLPISESDCT